MGKSLSLILISLTLVAGRADSTVRVGLYCAEPRFSAASTNASGVNYNLQLSRDQSDSPNGELVLQTSGYGGFLVLWDSGSGSNTFMPFNLAIPDYVDANRDSFHDFFEVSQSISGGSLGTYQDPVQGSAQLDALWDRSAGSKTGTCQLTLEGYGLTFIHHFEITEYKGTLTYSNSSGMYSGSISLSRTLATNSTLAGPVALVVIDKTDVSLNSGTWTNALGQAFNFQALDALQPSQFSRTNYLATLVVDDGDPSTAIQDYTDWVMIVSDSTDTNHNGVSDFSDPVTPPPLPPTLSIRLEGGALFITIAGEVGRTYDLQFTSSFGPTLWGPVSSVTLTNAVQDVSVDLPSDNTFFRALAH